MQQIAAESGFEADRKLKRFRASVGFRNFGFRVGIFKFIFFEFHLVQRLNECVKKISLHQVGELEKVGGWDYG
jgi:hypothetical protein